MSATCWHLQTGGQAWCATICCVIMVVVVGTHDGAYRLESAPACCRTASWSPGVVASGMRTCDMPQRRKQYHATQCTHAFAMCMCMQLVRMCATQTWQVGRWPLPDARLHSLQAQCMQHHAHALDSLTQPQANRAQEQACKQVQSSAHVACTKSHPLPAGVVGRLSSIILLFLPSSFSPLLLGRHRANRLPTRVKKRPLAPSKCT